MVGIMERKGWTCVFRSRMGVVLGWLQPWKLKQTQALLKESGFRDCQMVAPRGNSHDEAMSGERNRKVLQF